MENVINAYEKFNSDFNDSLIQYLNNLENAKMLSKNKIPKEGNKKQTYQEFTIKLLELNKINDESYSYLENQVLGGIKI